MNSHQTTTKTSRLISKYPFSGSKSSLVSPDCSETTQAVEEVIRCCSNDTEDNKRENGTEVHLCTYTNDCNSSLGYGSIKPDDHDSPGRSPGNLYFHNTYLHGEKELGFKIGDRVTYNYQLNKEDCEFDSRNLAKDGRMTDNG